MLVVLLCCVALVHLFVFASGMFVVCLIVDGFVGCLLVGTLLVVSYLLWVDCLFWFLAWVCLMLWCCGFGGLGIVVYLIVISVCFALGCLGFVV